MQALLESTLLEILDPTHRTDVSPGEFSLENSPLSIMSLIPPRADHVKPGERPQVSRKVWGKTNRPCYGSEYVCDWPPAPANV